MSGHFWPPLLSTAVFVYLQQSGYFTVGQTPVPYAVFLFAGLILWQLFCDAIAMPLAHGAAILFHSH
jgi:lipopolysaccharide transport system permease protein